jgi:hypothetical protein
MFVDKSNVKEYAEYLITDVSIQDSMGNNKVHLNECSVDFALKIVSEISKGMAPSCSVSANIKEDGSGEVFLYDNEEDFFCRSLFTWSK